MKGIWRCALTAILFWYGIAAVWSNIAAEITASQKKGKEPDMLTLFLSGDVMPGRGIDQVLPHPSEPVLYEAYVRDARDYVRLAEAANGPIPKPSSPAYIWGDALAVLAALNPDLRIINLESSVTASDDWLPKGINYRMHPGNIGCLTAARIDCCILANNHVLDWGEAGLVETLEVLTAAGIKVVGAGQNRQGARAPAVFPFGDRGRLLVLAYGYRTSGIPATWEAGEKSPGVNRLADLSDQTIDRLKKKVSALKQPGDVVLFSLHWGGNWGYSISPEERRFAQQLIDKAGIDVLYGHSSHHFKGIEVYHEKLILYGCGDFINDYEGIVGYEGYRADLTLMYFPVVEPSSGQLLEMTMVPMQIKRFQTVSPTPHDRQWIMDVLNREGQRFGTRVLLNKAGSLTLQWR